MDKKQERKHKYSQHISWGVTAFCVIAAGVLLYFGVGYLNDFIKALGKLMGILSPFIWGLVISYLLLPSMELYERKLFRPLVAKMRGDKPAKKKSKAPRVLALILSELVMLLLLAALVYLIVPQLYQSIATIINNSPEYASGVYSTIDRLLQNYPEIEEYATKIFGDLTTALTNWATNTLLPNMENLVSNITTGVINVVKVLYNMVIGIIVSVYLLYNKESVVVHYRRLLYCFFSPTAAKRVTEGLRFTDKTFMGFITGKLLDSAIIGVLCYLGCLIMRTPYSLLIAVIVGVTNIIPFFGPLIGAVPSALLVLIVDPTKCFWFVVFIIVLQQIDGNVIGPKILGTSIGINGFWVLFSIVLFGGIFGFIGMLIGVPVFVVIYTGIRMLVNRKLKHEGLPTDYNSYHNLDYIDPETLKPIKKVRKKAIEPEKTDKKE